MIPTRMTADRLILDRFIPYRLSIASNLVSDVIASAYESLFGLTIPEWRLIAVAAENDGITQQEIGVVTRMDKVTVSRAAIALGHRHLIERRPNTADRRSHLVALTTEGGRLYASVAPKALELERRIFERFDPATLDRFMAMLREIEAAALDVSGA
jgi:DNA-binding MarR family transcriptional regulator